MLLTFTPIAWADYQYWVLHDRDVLVKLNTLIAEVMRLPFQGLGKPEPLKGNLKGYWSRRISQEHRLVYRVEGAGAAQTLVIVQARFHYDS